MSEASSFDLVGLAKILGAAVASAFVGAFGGHKAAMREHGDYGRRILSLEERAKSEKARVTAALIEIRRDLAADRITQKEMHAQNREDMGGIKEAISDLIREIRDLWKSKVGAQ